MNTILKRSNLTTRPAKISSRLCWRGRKTFPLSIWGYVCCHGNLIDRLVSWAFLCHQVTSLPISIVRLIKPKLYTRFCNWYAEKIEVCIHNEKYLMPMYIIHAVLGNMSITSTIWQKYCLIENSPSLTQLRGRFGDFHRRRSPIENNKHNNIL